MKYCHVYEGDGVGNVRAAEIRPLPCQHALLPGLDRPLIKPLVQVAQQRHIAEHLLLYPPGMSCGDGG